MYSGGSGKTQVALKYADAFRQRYPGGIFFFSARSETTIVADLSRIGEALRLNDGSSLPGKFKEIINCLLIFDNADDPESILVSSYVPEHRLGTCCVYKRD